MMLSNPDSRLLLAKFSSRKQRHKSNLDWLRSNLSWPDLTFEDIAYFVTAYEASLYHVAT
nr:hypothetical protein DMOBY_06000 [Dehalococcoides mccartyi]